MEISRLKTILRRKLVLSKNIYIIGHDDIDLDAFGAIVGINAICKKYYKRPYVILKQENLEPGVVKAIKKVKKEIYLMKN